MKKVEAQTVGEIIDTLLKAEHLDGKMDEQRLLERWVNVVGPTVNKYTVSRYIKDHTLYVHLSSAPLRNELMMCRTSLVDSLNQAVGRPVITNIIIK